MNKNQIEQRRKSDARRALLCGYITKKEYTETIHGLLRINKTHVFARKEDTRKGKPPYYFSAVRVLKTKQQRELDVLLGLEEPETGYSTTGYSTFHQDWYRPLFERHHTLHRNLHARASVKYCRCLSKSTVSPRKHETVTGRSTRGPN